MEAMIEDMGLAGPHRRSRRAGRGPPQIV